MHEKIAKFSAFCVQKNIPKLTLKYIVNGISDKKREKKTLKICSIRYFLLFLHVKYYIV
jgi:hypothetical protein